MEKALRRSSIFSVFRARVCSCCPRRSLSSSSRGVGQRVSRPPASRSPTCSRSASNRSGSPPWRSWRRRPRPAQASSQLAGMPARQRTEPQTCQRESRRVLEHYREGGLRTPRLVSQAKRPRGASGPRAPALEMASPAAFLLRAESAREVRRMRIEDGQ